MAGAAPARTIPFAAEPGEVKNEMPAPDLDATIRKVRERILGYRKAGRVLGEQNTKVNLIEPVLAALGWDVHEIGEVRREYRVGAKYPPVDYALLSHLTPVLFVEAKALEENPRDLRWAMQVTSYAAAAGVEWCVLTNGDEYRILNALARAQIEEKLFRVARVSDADQHAATVDALDLLSRRNFRGDRLSVLWKAFHVDRQVARAVQRLLARPTEPFVRVVRAGTRGLAPREVRASLARLAIRVEIPDASQEKARSKPPRAHARKRDAKAPGKGAATPGLRDIILRAGLSFPLELEARYRRRTFSATVREDGSVAFDGASYASLSTAAGMARKSIIGAPAGRSYPQTNGWTFWKFKDPRTGRMATMDTLRRAER